jgi:transposase
VSTARVALTSEQGAATRVVLAEDLGLLEALDEQVAMAEQRLGVLVARTPFAVLTTTPGWSTVRAAGYAAAVGERARWPSYRQVYRASGLPPVVDASAGQRRDGAISREGSVALRRALLGLGVGLWRHDLPARAWAAQLRARGKAKGVIATALANRAGRIAFAMVRDQTAYQPDRSGVTGQHNGWSDVVGASVRRPELTPPAAMAGHRVTPRQAWCPASRHTSGARTRSADPATWQRSHTSA